MNDFPTVFSDVVHRHIAEKADVSPDHVRAWLSGERVPSVLSITKIALALGLSHQDMKRLVEAAGTTASETDHLPRT